MAYTPNDREQIAIHAREVDKKTFKAIGEMLNVTANRANQLYSTAKARIKRGGTFAQLQHPERLLPELSGNFVLMDGDSYVGHTTGMPTKKLSKHIYIKGYKGHPNVVFEKYLDKKCGNARWLQSELERSQRGGFTMSAQERTAFEQKTQRQIDKIHEARMALLPKLRIVKVTVTVVHEDVATGAQLT